VTDVSTYTVLFKTVGWPKGGWVFINGEGQIAIRDAAIKNNPMLRKLLPQTGIHPSATGREQYAIKPTIFLGKLAGYLQIETGARNRGDER